MIPKPPAEAYVGSSIQFQALSFEPEHIPDFIARLAARGVEVKWFGEADPRGFTSRYDSWHYLADTDPLPNTLAVLSNLLDMRIPLTFDEADCALIGRVIADEAAKLI